ncbi:unnamed protein product (macronuclear) [Paramecium tetraurelia]|uniref:Uncharacterized protein n=1 Tax=Paramecium tetraurelia TaxID=5888 RepID=A0BNF4_PARTE|nr:uncharacterized protein GSPATT00030709001 [Paramecium tetraurelia]CAK60071.1 unnamed protein product [Paramecium tetraurelia]|eukprot:XP_001427469.1 hypothetical protein (macronuclear) [Paramecium tetraurelia strain d4-2]
MKWQNAINNNYALYIKILSSDYNNQSSPVFLKVIKFITLSLIAPGCKLRLTSLLLPAERRITTIYQFLNIIDGCYHDGGMQKGIYLRVQNFESTPQIVPVHSIDKINYE